MQEALKDATKARVSGELSSISREPSAGIAAAALVLASGDRMRKFIELSQSARLVRLKQLSNLTKCACEGSNPDHPAR